MSNIAFQKEEFSILKQRLLLQRLNEITLWEAHAGVMVEANRSADLATQTSFPFLVFPCLFEERVAAAMQRFSQEEATYWRPQERQNAAVWANQ